MSASPEKFPEAVDISARTTEAHSENRGDAPLLPSREDLGPDDEDLDLDPAAVSEADITPETENLRDYRDVPSDQGGA